MSGDGHGASPAESPNNAHPAAASLVAPVQALLPFYGIAYSTTVVSALVQVAAIKMKPEFAAMCRE